MIVVMCHLAQPSSLRVICSLRNMLIFTSHQSFLLLVLLKKPPLIATHILYITLIQNAEEQGVCLLTCNVCITYTIKVLHDATTHVNGAQHTYTLTSTRGICGPNTSAERDSCQLLLVRSRTRHCSPGSPCLQNPPRQWNGAWMPGPQHQGHFQCHHPRQGQINCWSALF